MDRMSFVVSRVGPLVASLGLAAVVACGREGGGANGAATRNAGPYAKEVGEAVPLIEKAIGLPFALLSSSPTATRPIGCVPTARSMRSTRPAHTRTLLPHIPSTCSH